MGAEVLQVGCSRWMTILIIDRVMPGGCKACEKHLKDAEGMEMAFVSCGNHIYRVSVFICGKEHVGVEDACRVVPLKQPAVTGGHYEKGVSPSHPPCCTPAGCQEIHS
jgi:hypothetical protein